MVEEDERIEEEGWRKERARSRKPIRKEDGVRGEEEGECRGDVKEGRRSKENGGRRMKDAGGRKGEVGKGISRDLEKENYEKFGE